MAADANIFSQYLQPIRSVQDYSNDMDRSDLNALTIAASRVKNQTDAFTAKTQMDDRNALQRAASRWTSATTPEQRIADLRNAGSAGLMTQADALEKQWTDRQKAAADIGKTSADTQSIQFKTGLDKHKSAITQMASFTTPQDALASLNDAVAQGAIPTQVAKLMQTSMPQDPAQFDQWKLRMVIGMNDPEKMAEFLKPHLQTINAGNAQVQQAVDPITGQVRNTASTPVFQSPDNKATNDSHIQGIGIQQAGDDRRSKAMIAKDLTVSGINPDGSLNGDTKAMVDAIGQYKIQPPNGMALRNPRMQAILAQVAQAYPDFDATQYGARQQASKAFSTGKDGQAVQSTNTAMNHLETIQALATAQKNGNMQLFNQIANSIGTATGQPAPTNLRSAITMVAPEISKAIVGSSGGVDDRKKADAMLNPNASPDQMLGSIATIQELFGGRLSEAQRTYERTTGRKDFASVMLSPAAQKILAAKQGSQGGADIPPAVAAALAKHGVK